MPIYEYECRHCGYHFELKQSFHDKPGADCPECKKKAHRVFRPTPIIFKGSGFYVTDHRSGSDSATSKNPPESVGAKPESPKAKTDSPKAKPEAAKGKSEPKKSAE